MQFDQLKRREFISLLGGASAAWPLALQSSARSALGLLLQRKLDHFSVASSLRRQANDARETARLTQ